MGRVVEYLCTDPGCKVRSPWHPFDPATMALEGAEDLEDFPGVGAGVYGSLALIPWAVDENGAPEWSRPVRFHRESRFSQKILLPPRRLGDLPDRGVALKQQPAHVLAQKRDLGGASQ